MASYRRNPIAPMGIPRNANTSYIKANRKRGTQYSNGAGTCLDFSWLSITTTTGNQNET